MKTVLNGAEIYYEEEGDPSKPVIVLIHGFPFTHEMWKPQIATLTNAFHVIAYDVRGHGKSSVGDGQYTLEFFVDDLLGLLDHLKVEKAVMCGLSMGGYIALRATERAPRRVLALILADTQAKADSNEAKLKRAASIKAVKTSGVRKYAEGFVKLVFAEQTFSTKPDVVDAVKKLILSNSALGICGTLLALATRTDTTEALPNLAVPVLILVGEHDALTPVSASQEMRDKISNSEIHLIPNAGHMSNLENPQAFNDHVLRFLNRITGSKTD